MRTNREQKELKRGRGKRLTRYMINIYRHIQIHTHIQSHKVKKNLNAK